MIDHYTVSSVGKPIFVSENLIVPDELKLFASNAVGKQIKKLGTLTLRTILDKFIDGNLDIDESLIQSIHELLLERQNQYQSVEEQKRLKEEALKEKQLQEERREKLIDDQQKLNEKLADVYSHQQKLKQQLKELKEERESFEKERNSWCKSVGEYRRFPRNQSIYFDVVSQGLPLEQAGKRFGLGIAHTRTIVLNEAQHRAPWLFSQLKLKGSVTLKKIRENKDIFLNGDI